MAHITDMTKAEASALAAKKAVQAAALKASGPAAASEEEIELVRQYLECLREENRIKALKETIKELVEESMLGRGLNTLTYDGLNLVTISPTTSTTRNWKGLEEDHPTIAAQYTTSVPTTRTDFKKNVLPGT